MTDDERRRFDRLNKVFVVSAGRTGTNFLGLQLGKILPGAFSVHEPDRVDPGEWRDLLGKLARQGFGRLIVGKALGIYGSRNLSLMRVSGAISAKAMFERFLAERRWVLRHADEASLESNPQLFGLGEDLAGLPGAKVAFFVRDPRTWVPSWMGKRWFGPTDWMEKIGRLGFKRLNPSIAGEPDVPWGEYGPLEKLCWTWRCMNRMFLRASRQGRANVALFRYEDVFEHRHEETIREFVGFVSHRGCVEEQAARLVDLMRERINPRKDKGPRLYETWSRGEKRALEELCGGLARELGYEFRHYEFRQTVQ